MTLRRYGRKQYWQNLRYCAGTWLERLRKTMKNVSEMVSRLRFELRTSCIWSRSATYRVMMLGVLFFRKIYTMLQKHTSYSLHWTTTVQPHACIHQVDLGWLDNYCSVFLYYGLVHSLFLCQHWVYSSQNILILFTF